MNPSTLNRRGFLRRAGGGAGMALAAAGPMIHAAKASEHAGKPAILGGNPVRKDPFPSWPQVHDNDREAWDRVLEARGWCRLDGDAVNAFETRFAEMNGSPFCLATANGTSALLSCLNAMEIGPGDEVLVPPYTFVATINVVLNQHALPVFVDTDRETFQMDPSKIEEKITGRTRCIMPVHLGGNPADMDAILAIGQKHGIPVLEDACQAHLAEWRGKKVGTLGAAGCFSFQVTKNLSGGEGGAVLTASEDIMDRCYSFHSNGRERKNTYGFSYINNGLNVRMTEFQGALLGQQMTRLEAQTKTRDENAAYLTSLLNGIEGIEPAKMYPGATRNAYHLYMMRYDPAGFSGLPRAKFLSALSREGIPCAKGYSPLNKEPFLGNTIRSRGYEAIYSPETIRDYFANNDLPENDKLCNEEAVWFFQTMLLAERGAMDQIAEAVRKIQKHAAEINKA